MAEPEQETHGQGHEAIHLPPPSIWPPVLALGLALILNRVVLIAGLVIAVFATALWVRDARREFGELPE